MENAVPCPKQCSPATSAREQWCALIQLAFMQRDSDRALLSGKVLNAHLWSRDGGWSNEFGCRWGSCVGPACRLAQSIPFDLPKQGIYFYTASASVNVGE